MSELFRLKATSLKMGDNLKVGHRHDSYKKICVIFFLPKLVPVCRAKFSWFFNQSISQSNYFIVRSKVDQRAGQLSLPHVGITKTVNEYN